MPRRAFALGGGNYKSMTERAVKIFVTKYALTAGIQEVDAEVKSKMAHWKVGGWSMYAHGEGRDWHKTREAAVVRAEHIRAAKIHSLHRSIKKLEAKTF